MSDIVILDGGEVIDLSTPAPKRSCAALKNGKCRRISHGQWPRPQRALLGGRGRGECRRRKAEANKRSQAEEKCAESVRWPRSLGRIERREIEEQIMQRAARSQKPVRKGRRRESVRIDEAVTHAGNPLRCLKRMASRWTPMAGCQRLAAQNRPRNDLAEMQVNRSDNRKAAGSPEGRTPQCEARPGERKSREPRRLPPMAEGSRGNSAPALAG